MSSPMQAVRPNTIGCDISSRATNLAMARQTTMVGLMRSIFGSRVLTHPMVKSTAIADAGLTKQTLYEVERQQFTRGTYDRASRSPRSRQWRDRGVDQAGLG